MLAHILIYNLSYSVSNLKEDLGVILQSIEQVTPDWLTEQLRAKTALQQGKVTRLEGSSETFNRGFMADITKFKVSYSSDASGQLPENLLLKRAKPNLHPELVSRSSHEAKFYQAMASLTTRLPIPTCYSVEYDPITHQAHILMEDLSATHFQRPLPIPPSNRHCEMIVESLAQVHAAWWNSPNLGKGIGERLDIETASAMEQRLIDTVPAFFDYLGDALLPQQRRTIEQIIASDFLSRLSQRLCDMRQVTLVHGDAHTGNLMLPRDETMHQVMLIDWQLWAINVAAIDLAFLIALHWSPQRRALLEETLLRRYHDHLLAGGATNYTWSDLWHDYRQSVIIMALIPIGQFRRKSPAGAIWFGLQDSLAAFEDLNCTELL